MANFGPQTAEIGLGVWASQEILTGLRLAFVTAATSVNGGQPNFALCLAASSCGTLYIHIWLLLPPDGILYGAKFSLRLSLAFSCIGSVTARHSSSRRLPNFAAWYKEWNCGMLQRAPPIFRWAAITLGIGPYSSCNYATIIHRFPLITTSTMY